MWPVICLIDVLIGILFDDVAVLSLTTLVTNVGPERSPVPILNILNY
jgi:hypothetical protein